MSQSRTKRTRGCSADSPAIRDRLDGEKRGVYARPVLSIGNCLVEALKHYANLAREGAHSVAIVSQALWHDYWLGVLGDTAGFSGAVAQRLKL